MENKQQEYLRLLQERNRLKKKMYAKSKEELAKEELERGFSTHFRGAHAQKNSAVASNPVVVSSTPAISGKSTSTNKKGWGPPVAKGSLSLNINSSNGVSDLIEKEDEYESDFDAEDNEVLMEESLVQRIISLDIKQKQKLLTLLQANNESDETANINTKSKKKMQQHTISTSPEKNLIKAQSSPSLIAKEFEFPVIQTTAIEETIIKSPKKTNNFFNSLEDSQIDKQVVYQLNDDQPVKFINNEFIARDSDHSINSNKMSSPSKLLNNSSQNYSDDNSSVPSNDPQVISTTQIFTSSVIIKIQLMTTSLPSKHVSLESLFLYRNGNNILSQVSVRLSTGLIPLPNSSEAYRSLTTLIDPKKRVVTSIWRGPISSTSPFVFNIEVNNFVYF